jgi:hypothetical protein
MKLIPARKFRLYPSKGTRLYYECYIWNRRQEMRRVHRIICGKFKHENRVMAFVECCVLRDKKTKRKLRCIGECHFYLHDIGGGIVSHEMTHAAVGYMHRKGMVLDFRRKPFTEADFGKKSRVIKGAEEDLCTVIGTLVRQFYIKCERLGVMKATSQKRLTLT